MRVAAAQVRCPWMDREAGLRKVIDFVGRAAAAGVELVVFPETFLPGYPIWLTQAEGARFDDARQESAYAAYRDAAIELTGPELRMVAEYVRDHGVFTYLGIAERGPGRGTVYRTLLAKDEERLVIADIDPTAVRGARQGFDPTGHYSRPDVFQVTVGRRRLASAAFLDQLRRTRVDPQEGLARSGERLARRMTGSST